jgi:hypothetical protein
MGHIMNFLVALEAEDITKDVDKEMKKAIGSRSIKSTIDKDDSGDIGKTDDILGTKGNKKEDATQPVKDKNTDIPEEDDTDTTNLDDENPDNFEDDNMDSENSENLDTLGDDTGKQDENIPSDENNIKNEELTNKIALRENMILFYNILSSNIKLLSEYTPDNDIEKNKDVISKVSGNFIECRDILFNILTEELESNSYVELLRKYVALCRVYDLNILILDTYFSDLKLISTKNKK